MSAMFTLCMITHRRGATGKNPLRGGSRGNGAASAAPAAYERHETAFLRCVTGAGCAPAG
jgi:hypothetical protein